MVEWSAFRKFGLTGYFIYLLIYLYIYFSSLGQCVSNYNFYVTHFFVETMSDSTMDSILFWI